MIPKIIHYCWFGEKPLDPKVIRNINSWKKYCPNYKIVQWNESNFDVKKYQFAYEAYKKRQWAFVSDVARLDIVYNNGGFYLDTDVELLRSLDCFRKNKVFFAREDNFTVNTGVGFGSEPYYRIVLKNLLEYEEKHFINNDGTLNKILCVDVTTNLLSQMGFKPSKKIQIKKFVKIYPRDYFCPIRIGSGRMVITKNTVSIHHYEASWTGHLNSKERFLIPIKKRIKFCVDHILGFGTYNKLKKYLKSK